MNLSIDEEPIPYPHELPEDEAESEAPMSRSERLVLGGIAVVLTAACAWLLYGVGKLLVGGWHLAVRLL